MSEPIRKARVYKTVHGWAWNHQCMPDRMDFSDWSLKSWAAAFEIASRHVIRCTG